MPASGVAPLGRSAKLCSTVSVAVCACAIPMATNVHVSHTRPARADRPLGLQQWATENRLLRARKPPAMLAVSAFRFQIDVCMKRLSRDFGAELWFSWLSIYTCAYN